MNGLAVFSPNIGEETQVLSKSYGSPALAASVVIVSEYLKYNPCSADGVAALLLDIHKAAFAALSSEREDRPAVVVEDSISDEYLICLEDGKKVKSLSRYLKGHFNMTPDEYRGKWGLPEDYPMVAPALSRKRAAIARDVQPHKAKKSARVS